MNDSLETPRPTTLTAELEARVLHPPQRLTLQYCLAIVSAAAAVIHFAVSGEHFEEYWVFGVFMLVVAWLQLVWGVLAALRPTRLLLWGGAALNAGIIAVYIVTRTVGDVIGPTPHDVEPFGFGDGLCTVLEAVIVAGCLWLLATNIEHVANRQAHTFHPLAVPGTLAALLAVLLSVALVDGGPEMVMSASGDAGSGEAIQMAMSSTSASAPSIHLATTSPAGAVTMPDPTMQMAAGMKMASSSACTAMPTSAQEHATVKLVDASWRDSEKYQSLAAAKEAGYRAVTPSGQAVVHYINRADYISTLTGSPVLNPAAPQSLVYANTPHGAVLVAAMYIASPMGPTPKPGGCLTQWHIHTNLCFSPRQGVVGDTDPTCPAGSTNRVTPAMFHVWFVPIPGGPTAVDAPDAQVVHAAEKVDSPVNATA